MNKNKKISFYPFMLSLAGVCFLLGTLSLIGAFFYSSVIIHGKWLVGLFIGGFTGALISFVSYLIFIEIVRNDMDKFINPLKLIIKSSAWISFCLACSYTLSSLFLIVMNINANINDFNFTSLLFTTGFCILCFTAIVYYGRKFLNFILNFLLDLDEILDNCEAKTRILKDKNEYLEIEIK